MIRRLSTPKLIGLILLFLFVPQLASLFAVAPDGDESGYDSVRAALRYELLPDLGGAVIAIAAIGRLRWVDLVVHERLRTRRWVWVVPAAMVAGPVLMVDREHLAAAGLGLTMALAVGTFFTGLSEELMFRGLTLQAMRQRRRETRAAVLTAVIFGAFHLLNVVVVGAAAIPQALLAVALGYLLYLCRRVSGGIAVAVVVHWLWDFSTFSSTVGRDADASSDSAFYLFLLTLGLTVLVALRRRSIGPVCPGD